MELDINYQNFLGHSEEIRKVFFTDDNMHVISIGDSILIWNVLAWNTAQPTMPNNGQCIVPPQSVMTKILENPSIRSNSNSSEVLHYSQSMNENTARTITQTLSKSEIEKIETISQEEKKIINKKLLKKQNDNDYSPSSRRLLIQRINHSKLAKVISLLSLS